MEPTPEELFDLLSDPAFRAYVEDPRGMRRDVEAIRAAAAAPPPSDRGWVTGARGREPWIALVLKRTYAVDGGLCVPSDEPEMLVRGDVPYFDDEDLPTDAPLCYTNELVAGRERTDVVVQGSAYSYGGRKGTTLASIQLGPIERGIRVYGSRRGDFDAKGKPVFTPPEPFDFVPLRYDFAYGGFDARAFLRRAGPRKDEGGPPKDTPFHYPRNPCGRGFLHALDEEGFRGLAIPHLEHPFDPLTPERLAIGDAADWLDGPLPACWDWTAATWFPRCAFLGMSPPFRRSRRPPAEVERGWAPRDLLDIPSLFQTLDTAKVRLEWGQAASPGMQFADLPPDTPFELRSLCEEHPRWSFRLPGEVPKASVRLDGVALTELAPKLQSVCIRPDHAQVACVWALRAKVARAYEERELEELPVAVDWVVTRG
jgi:Uncharacterized protein conserved in bacteria (DUF2169)